MIEAFDYLRELNTPSVLLRLTLAMFCGGMLGLDRGRKRRPAGFRTYMLVCMGAAMTGIISQYLYVMLATRWLEVSALMNKQVDVSRIGAKAIGGVGFLGAGTILMTERHQVTGLTTAAGLWASACLGIAIGAGFYECVLVAFLLMFVCMRLLPRLESHLMESSRNMNIYLEFTSMKRIGDIIDSIKALNVHVYEVEVERGKKNSSANHSAVFSLRLSHRMHHEQVLAAIAEEKSIVFIREI